MSLADGSRFRVGTPFDRVRHSVTPSGPYNPLAATAVVWPWQVGTFIAAEAAPADRAAALFAPPAWCRGAAVRCRRRPGRSAADQASGALRARTGDELDAPVRATYRVFEALAAPGQITYGTNWTIDPAHPLATDPGSAPAGPARAHARRSADPVVEPALRQPSAGRAGTRPADGDAGSCRRRARPGRAREQSLRHAPRHLAPPAHGRPRPTGQRPRWRPVGAGGRGRRPERAARRRHRDDARRRDLEGGGTSRPASTPPSRSTDGRTSRSACARPIASPRRRRSRSRRRCRAGGSSPSAR